MERYISLIHAMKNANDWVKIYSKNKMECTLLESVRKYFVKISWLSIKYLGLITMKFHKIACFLIHLECSLTPLECSLIINLRFISENNAYNILFMMGLRDYVIVYMKDFRVVFMCLKYRGFFGSARPIYNKHFIVCKIAGEHVYGHVLTSNPSNHNKEVYKQISTVNIFGLPIAMYMNISKVLKLPAKMYYTGILQRSQKADDFYNENQSEIIKHSRIDEAIQREEDVNHISDYDHEVLELEGELTDDKGNNDTD